MKKCIYCAGIIQDNSVFCSYCGHELGLGNQGKISALDTFRKDPRMIKGYLGELGWLLEISYEYEKDIIEQLKEVTASLYQPIFFMQEEAKIISPSEKIFEIDLLDVAYEITRIIFFIGVELKLDNLQTFHVDMLTEKLMNDYLALCKTLQDILEKNFPKERLLKFEQVYRKSIELSFEHLTDLGQHYWEDVTKKYEETDFASPFLYGLRLFSYTSIPPTS